MKLTTLTASTFNKHIHQIHANHHTDDAGGIQASVSTGLCILATFLAHSSVITWIMQLAGLRHAWWIYARPAQSLTLLIPCTSCTASGLVFGYCLSISVELRLSQCNAIIRISLQRHANSVYTRHEPLHYSTTNRDLICSTPKMLYNSLCHTVYKNAFHCKQSVYAAT